MGHSLGTYSSTCRAAIITDVKDDTTVSLTVFSAKGLFFYEGITLDEGNAGGTWHWPERVEAPTSSILPANFKPPKADPPESRRS
jgi:hypothetical protein